MVFCNMKKNEFIKKYVPCHNPYFNRWFSAILNTPNFILSYSQGHNPYFNRWFSAIRVVLQELRKLRLSQSLF